MFSSSPFFIDEVCPGTKEEANGSLQCVVTRLGNCAEVIQNNNVIFQEMRKERKKRSNFLTMMNPMMARSIKNQFQRTKVIDDLFKRKGT